MRRVTRSRIVIGWFLHRSAPSTVRSLLTNSRQHFGSNSTPCCLPGTTGIVEQALSGRGYAVLIPSGDASLVAISRHRDLVEPHLSAPIGLPPHEVVAAATDKSQLAAVVEDAGPHIDQLRDLVDEDSKLRRQIDAALKEVS